MPNLARSITIAALFAFAACGKSDAPKTADCPAVGAALGQGLKKLSDEERATAITRIVETCRNDGWTGAQTACFANAKSGADAGKCAGTLTPTQASSFKVALGR